MVLAAVSHPPVALATGSTDLLALAVEAVAAVRPFGLDHDGDLELRWTLGPDASSVYVTRDGTAPLSVMVRLSLP